MSGPVCYTNTEPVFSSSVYQFVSLLNFLQFNTSWVKNFQKKRKCEQVAYDQVDFSEPSKLQKSGLGRLHNIFFATYQKRVCHSWVETACCFSSLFTVGLSSGHLSSNCLPDFLEFESNADIISPTFYFDQLTTILTTIPCRHWQKHTLWELTAAQHCF